MLERDGLPKELVSAVKFLIDSKKSIDADNVTRKAEKRRHEIASQGNKEVPIWYSPTPGSAGDDLSADGRPKPGKTLNFTMERVAKTGKDERWGTALYLLARDSSASVAVELGSCAGISGIYISSAPDIDSFLTVEGSKALSELAKQSLSTNKNSEVINSLFDQAIDVNFPSIGKSIELAFIDGHHEKVATIHYFNRLLPLLSPGAIVIFDDISWSQDMRSAWEYLSQREEFSDAVDLAAIGVAIIRKDQSTKSIPKYWNLQSLVGKQSIGAPHGWER